MGCFTQLQSFTWVITILQQHSVLTLTILTLVILTNSGLIYIILVIKLTILIAVVLTNLIDQNNLS